ncbi:MAG: cupin domain-containing protein [Solirubrobacterales bacterium]|nr:cupin domain-containing protein [Solirubrobacterales bacterium]
MSEKPPQRGPAEWFTGEVWLEPVASLATTEPTQISRVTFRPGARTAWHTHPHGQVLHVLNGVARIGRDGQRVVEARPGDTVTFAAGERHWHGASAQQEMSHLAIQPADPASGQAADWAEHVTDAEYLDD